MENKLYVGRLSTGKTNRIKEDIKNKANFVARSKKCITFANCKIV